MSHLTPYLRPETCDPYRASTSTKPRTCRPNSRILPTLPFLTAIIILLTLLQPQPVHAIKFALQAHRYPSAKCIWNAVHANQLVVVTAGVAEGEQQRVDIEIIDSSPQKNVYLSRKGINAETRLAVTAHADGEVGVCFRNYLDHDVAAQAASTKSRTIDLDVDIGADAVDYNAIANQESLSALETEMRKLEGIVAEIVDELQFLKKREERFSGTNESTNARVQRFGFFTFIALVALGIWQIFHLRSFFKRKYLID